MRLTLYAQFWTDCINFIYFYWSHLLNSIHKFTLYKYRRVRIYTNQCWIIIHWRLWEQNAVNFELWYTFSKSHLQNGVHFHYFSQCVKDWLLTLTIRMVNIECNRLHWLHCTESERTSITESKYVRIHNVYSLHGVSLRVWVSNNRWSAIYRTLIL